MAEVGYTTTPARQPTTLAGRSRHRHWPLTWHDLGVLITALVVIIGIGTLVGRAVTDWFAPNAITRLDLRIARDLAANRTGTRTDLATWGATVANTPVKIAVTLLVAGVMAYRWRRWHEPVFVLGTLLFEAAAFIVTTTLVQRPRPDVERLLSSPVNSSFPSGHVAAATVYAVFAVVVFWHTRSAVARTVAVVAAVVVPLVVAWSRMYQGMHNLSDVVAGVVLGVVSLVICLRVIGPPPTGATVGEDLR